MKVSISFEGGEMRVSIGDVSLNEKDARELNRILNIVFNEHQAPLIYPQYPVPLKWPEYPIITYLSQCSLANQS